MGRKRGTPIKTLLYWYWFV